MADRIEKLRQSFKKAEIDGGWNMFAVDVMGDADTGDEQLDAAIENLYRAGELVHLIANKLRLRHDLGF